MGENNLVLNRCLKNCTSAVEVGQARFLNGAVKPLAAVVKKELIKTCNETIPECLISEFKYQYDAVVQVFSDYDMTGNKNPFGELVTKVVFYTASILLLFFSISRKILVAFYEYLVQINDLQNREQYLGRLDGWVYDFLWVRLQPDNKV